MRCLGAPRLPLKKAAVLPILQLRDFLAACNSERPQDELIVRMLVGAGFEPSSFARSGTWA
jgi:hypothetical protein